MFLPGTESARMVVRRYQNWKMANKINSQIAFGDFGVAVPYGFTDAPSRGEDSGDSEISIGDRSFGCDFLVTGSSPIGDTFTDSRS